MHPPADVMEDPPFGDTERKSNPPQWEFQKVTEMRKGPCRALLGDVPHYWPVNISNPLLRADAASARAADLVLLPENAQKPIPKYLPGPLCRHSSACLISGGGTPRERGQLKASCASQAVYTGKPCACKSGGTNPCVIDPGSTGGGHWHDYWIINCLAYSSTAAVHRDGFWELLLQWPARGRSAAEFDYQFQRCLGIAACEAHLSKGPPGHGRAGRACRSLS